MGNNEKMRFFDRLNWERLGRVHLGIVKEIACNFPFN